MAPELARLTRALNITSHYAVLDGTEVLYLCKEDPPTLGIQLASAIGARLPSHLTAVGKACLAWLEADCLPGHVELATRGADGQTISLPDLTAELAQIRVQGFATDDGAAAAGIQGVAAPVFGLTGLKGAIGVSLLRGSGASLNPVADDVKTAAVRATIALGGTTPDHHVLPRNDHADQRAWPAGSSAAMQGVRPFWTSGSPRGGGTVFPPGSGGPRGVGNILPWGITLQTLSGGGNLTWAQYSYLRVRPWRAELPRLRRQGAAGGSDLLPVRRQPAALQRTRR